MLTARASTGERVAGLDAGADDYLVKPFEMDELEARLRALSRRAVQALHDDVVLGKLRYQPDQRMVQIDGVAFDLPRRELSLLEALLRARGGVVSKADLIGHLYGTGADIEESAVEAHVSRLRKKLVPAAIDIRTLRGLGYALQERNA